MNPITPNQRHMLRLTRQGADGEGWAKISAQLWPVVQSLKLPPELVTLEQTETGGRAKLTTAGQNVLDWT